MGWTTPRTWVAGEEVTATLLNAHLRDQLRFMHGQALPRVRLETTEQFTEGGNLITRSVLWQRAAYDPADIWGGGATISVPTGGDGVWRIGAGVQMQANGPGWGIEIELDGTGGGGTRLSGAAMQDNRWSEHRCIPHTEAALTAGQTLALTLRGAPNPPWLGWWLDSANWRWGISAAMWARLVAV